MQSWEAHISADRMKNQMPAADKEKSSPTNRRLGARRHLALAIANGIIFLSQTPALAGDAYDDDQRAIEPELEDPDTEESERADESLRAGGLEAPEAMPEVEDSRSEIEKNLEKADEKDSGRGLEFVWLNGEIGFQLLSLTSLSNNNLVPDRDSTFSSSLELGAGAGIRVLYFTMGARFRYAPGADYNLWSLLGEAGLHIPLGSFEPHVVLGLGYSGVTAFETGSGDLDPFGGVALRLGGGLEYYLSDSFSVGARMTGEMLFLKRPAARDSFCDSCGYLKEGSGVGTGLQTSLLVGLHF